MNARTYLIGGIALILLSILICAASAWNMVQIEPTATAITVRPSDTPSPSVTAKIPTPFPTSTPTQTPVPAVTTPFQPTSTPVLPSPATKTAGDSVSVSVTPVAGDGLPQPSLVTGIVATDFGRLNLRSGPNVNYDLVTRLENGVKVTILRQTSERDWLEIQTEAQQTGWVTAQYIKVSGQPQDIPVAYDLPPTPTPSTGSGGQSGPETFDVYGGRAGGSLTPYTERWYTFAEDDNPGSITLVWMFDPNVNLNGDEAHFFIYDQQQIPVWSPHEPDALSNLGAGSRPADDRDGNLGNGELLWQGGPLSRNQRYYIRVVNNSTSTLKYCLTSRNVYQWDCR